MQLEVGTFGKLDGLVLMRKIVVSQVYGIYDPLGLLTPITIRYMLLLQKLSQSLQDEMTH